MSETNGMIYCPECGKENLNTYKFCNSCGARLDGQGSAGEQPSMEEPQLTYERADAEIVSEGKVPLTQKEININYESADEGSYSSGAFTTPKPEYYSETPDTGSNGNIGFSIASMVCGIMSLLCCCFNIFALILAIMAIVLGIISLNGKYDGRGMAIAGLVTGGIGIAVWLLVLILNISGAALSALDGLL